MFKTSRKSFKFNRNSILFDEKLEFCGSRRKVGKFFLSDEKFSCQDACAIEILLLLPLHMIQDEESTEFREEESEMKIFFYTQQRRQVKVKLKLNLDDE